MLEIAAGILQVLNLNPQPSGKQRTAAPVKEREKTHL